MRVVAGMVTGKGLHEQWQRLFESDFGGTCRLVPVFSRSHRGSYYDGPISQLYALIGLYPGAYIGKAESNRQLRPDDYAVGYANMNR